MLGPDYRLGLPLHPAHRRPGAGARRLPLLLRRLPQHDPEVRGRAAGLRRLRQLRQAHLRRLLPARRHQQLHLHLRLGRGEARARHGHGAGADLRRSASAASGRACCSSRGSRRPWSPPSTSCGSSTTASACSTTCSSRCSTSCPRAWAGSASPSTAMASVIGVNIWRGFPFFGISFLAGMKAIPAEMYEAAAVDGASAAPALPPRHAAGHPEHRDHRRCCCRRSGPSTTSRSSTS